MAERLITYPANPPQDKISRFLEDATEVNLDSSQQLLLRENPIILPSDSSEALITLPYLDNSQESYPYYVNHEGFIVGPRKIGKHAWLVGGQENRVETIPINANSLLIGNILIDPGSQEGIPYLMENIAQLGKDLEDIELVLITHGHLDHIEAINDLQMLGLVAPVFVPEKSVDQITHADVMKIGMDLYDREFRPFRIDGIMNEETIFNLPDFSIRLHSCPGHSEDHMYFEFTDNEGDRMYVVGDLLLGGERKEFGYNEIKWKDSLHNFISQVSEKDEIFTGHHPTVLHKNEKMMKAIGGFGMRHWDLVSTQPGMLMSPWP